MVKELAARTVNLVVQIFKYFAKTELGIVKPDRIGHLVGEIDIYIRRRELNRVPSKLLIVTGKPCNAEVVRLLRRYVKIICSPLLYKLLQFISRYAFTSNTLLALQMTTQEYELYKSCPAVVKMITEDIARGYNEIERQFGIKKNDWWVCFHARDKEFLKYSNSIDNNYHDFRDSDVDAMVPAMERIAELGGYAIRFGHNPEKRLKTNNPKIIDYSFSGRNEFLDVFLSAKALFFIGNTSGPIQLPKLFDTPYAMCNLIAYGHMSPHPDSMFIPKTIFDSDGDVMKFDDCAALGMFVNDRTNIFYDSKTYSDLELTIQDNSADDILGLTNDMLNFIKGAPISKETRNYQKFFKDRYYRSNFDRHDAGNLAPSFIKSHAELF